VGRRPLDHLGDFVEVVIRQRLLDGVVRYVACFAHHMLLSAIPMTRRRVSQEPDRHASLIPF
jgi:hypothetical protein